MTTETRLATVEAQLQSLTGHMLGLSNAHLQQTERMNGLIDLTAANARAITELRTATDTNARAIAELRAATDANARAIAELKEAIERLTQAIDAKFADLDQKLEQYTDGLMGMIDQGLDAVIARRIEPMHADITGLRLEMQRLIERLNP